MTTSTPALAVRGLTRTYGSGDHGVTALGGVDLLLPQASFTAVMGPSGSGKSTLLNLVAGLDVPTAGAIALAGEDTSGWSEARRTRMRRDHIGIVFQGFQLVPYLTAEQNVGLPIRLAGRRPDRRRVAQLLADVGLGNRAGHLPGRALRRSAAACRDRSLLRHRPRRSSSPMSRPVPSTPSVAGSCSACCVPPSTPVRGRC